MCKRISVILAILSTGTGWVSAADIILNEYNAVRASRWLDCDGLDCLLCGGPPCKEDMFFGRVRGNGGNWFELVVTHNHVDMRGWRLDWTENPSDAGTLMLTDDPLWSDLRAGTIITFTELDTAAGGLDTDPSYDPVADDWWININTLSSAGVPQEDYVTTTTNVVGDGLGNFSVGNDNWQLTIKDADSNVIFGPGGEGIAGFSNVSSRDVGKLEENPTSAITPGSNYNDGTSSSFGHPNIWGGGGSRQDFTCLRCDDGEFCNGTEACDANGVCQPGDDPCPGQLCRESDDRCVNCLNTDDCDDELFCNGAEACDSNGVCQPGDNPCPGQLCRESDDRCVDCLSAADCDDGQFCNGAETCDGNGACWAGIEPCADRAHCDEGGDRCLECVDNTECDDGDECTDDACADGVCTFSPVAGCVGGADGTTPAPDTNDGTPDEDLSASAQDLPDESGDVSSQLDSSDGSDDDRDGDGVLDPYDLCPDISDSTNADEDGDGVGDACAPESDPEVDAESEREPERQPAPGAVSRVGCGVYNGVALILLPMTLLTWKGSRRHVRRRAAGRPAPRCPGRRAVCGRLAFAGPCVIGSETRGRDGILGRCPEWEERR